MRVNLIKSINVGWVERQRNPTLTTSKCWVSFLNPTYRYYKFLTELDITPFISEAAPNFLGFLFLSLCPTLREAALRLCVLCGSLRQAAPRLPSSYSLAHLHTELVLQSPNSQHCKLLALLESVENHWC